MRLVDCGEAVVGRPSPSFIFVGKGGSVGSGDGGGGGEEGATTGVEAFFLEDC